MTNLPALTTVVTVTVIVLIWVAVLVRAGAQTPDPEPAPVRTQPPPRPTPEPPPSINRPPPFHFATTNYTTTYSLVNGNLTRQVLNLPAEHFESMLPDGRHLFGELYYLGVETWTLFTGVAEYRRGHRTTPNSPNASMIEKQTFATYEEAMAYLRTITDNPVAYHVKQLL